MKFLSRLQRRKKEPVKPSGETARPGSPEQEPQPEKKSVTLSRKGPYLGAAAGILILCVVAMGLSGTDGQKTASVEETAQTEELPLPADSRGPASQLREITGGHGPGLARDFEAEAKAKAEAARLEAERQRKLKEEQDRQRPIPGSASAGVSVNMQGATQGMSQEELNIRNRVRQMRQNGFEQALQKTSAVALDTSGGISAMPYESTVTPSGGDRRMTALDARKAQLNRRMQELSYNGGTGMRALGGPEPQQYADPASPATAVQGSGEWDSGFTLENPSSPYLVRAGTILPATLISGINSDLPGQIIAQVSQNVYDSATGFHLLVPQGTRLYGSYQSGIAFGQERVMVAWNRLIYPDGRTLTLTSMPGADMGGYSGFTDLVDNHWMRLFGGAFLMSGITAGVAVATDDEDSSDSSDDEGTSLNDELTRAMAVQFGSIIAQVVERNLNVSPTLEIRPGYKFNVFVTKDLSFAGPYREFGYEYAD